MLNKLTRYIRESLEEMKKVTWPTRKETRSYTILVIIISVGVAFFLGGLDFIFNYILQYIINR
jgi:preprotein translocase subunit SecE